MYWINGIVSELCLTTAMKACLSLDKDKGIIQHTDHTQQDDDDTTATNNNKNEKSHHPTFSSSDHTIAIQPSHHASFFVSCTPQSIYLWSVKPTSILSFVKRSDKHVEEFGRNKSILWKPDGSSFVVLTEKNYLLLYLVLSYDQRSFDFEFPTNHHAYVTGPGEGKGSRTMLIKFRLAIRVDAGVACGSCSDDTLIIATEKPPAIQCISWNPQQTNSTQTSVQHRLGIFVDQNEHVETMIYDKLMNISVWITNVGRVYFIQNQRQRRDSKSSINSDSSIQSPKSPHVPSFTEPIHWSGRCFHGNTTTSDSFDPATCIAVNAKFSLIAVGTESGAIYVYSVRNYTTTPILSHQMKLPAITMAASASKRQSNGIGNHTNGSTSFLSSSSSPPPPPSSSSSSATPTASTQQKQSSSTKHHQIGSIQSLTWSLDGYALSAGFLGYGGLAVWSIYGALLCSMDDVEDLVDTEDGLTRVQDTYIQQVSRMFWGPGSHQLFVLSQDTKDPNSSRLYTVPFAKSALTSFHNSDNARRGLLQMDDRLLLYNNGGDYQENNTNTIDPDAVAWTHILYPSMYITEHWPIRYASISSDGKYIAVAGRRGLAHFNTLSNRWKLFGNQQQEQQILVRGGLVWYKNILIVACEILPSPGSYDSNKTYEIHMHSRDHNLDQAYILHMEPLHSIPVFMTICGNTLLVYTLDNQLSIYSVHYVEGNLPATRIDLVRQLSLAGIVARAARVRAISLFHGDCGDRIYSMDDITLSNILLLVDGKLMMLSPKFPSDDDDSDLTEQHGFQGSNGDNRNGHWTYDLHVLMEEVEYYWVGQKSVANLWTSIWAVDGHGVKVFTNVMRGDGYGFQAFNKENMMAMMESEPSTPTTPIGPGNGFQYRDIGARPYSLGYRIGIEPTSPHSQSWMEMEGESRWQMDLHQLDSKAIYIPLDFYPHAVLLDKGVIVGMEQNIIYRDTLGFLQYKTNTKTHLFIHHLIRNLLQQQLEEDAVVFARAYERLIYFGHSLEILLHTVLEEEAERTPPDNQDAILPLVIRFLDQFPHALDVIVSCARKTEVALWDHLFASVGKPEDLFELCLTDGRLRTATSYLIILQTMQPLTTGGKDTIRLLQKAMDVDDYELCKELVRFLSSIDHTGKTLHEALSALQSRMVEKSNEQVPLQNGVNSVVQGMQEL